MYSIQASALKAYQTIPNRTMVRHALKLTKQAKQDKQVEQARYQYKLYRRLRGGPS